MTKQEALNQVYPDEVKLIQRKDVERRLAKIMDNTCIMGGDEAQEHFKELQNRVKKLKTNDKAKPKEYTEEYIEEQISKVESMFG